jgi:hypothetical protein
LGLSKTDPAHVSVQEKHRGRRPPNSRELKVYSFSFVPIRESALRPRPRSVVGEEMRYATKLERAPAQAVLAGQRAQRDPAQESEEERPAAREQQESEPLTPDGNEIGEAGAPTTK